MRESLQYFADMMEMELLANDEKGGWEDCGDDYLAGQIADHFDQFRRAEGVDKIKACVDIANYAMMIADNERRRMT